MALRDTTSIDWGLEGRCLQRQGAAIRFRLGDGFDALSCIYRPWFDEGRSGSPPETGEELEGHDDLAAATPC
jgi:hypothetical protein